MGIQRRSSQERSLARRLCLVLQVPWLLRLSRLVCKDSVANSQAAKKGGDVPRLFRCPVRDVLGELVDLRVPVLEQPLEGGHHGVLEHGQPARKLLELDNIHSAFSRRRAMLRLGDAFAVHYSVDGALLELHDVLRQRAGFVGKDVFDLTEVVRDTPVLGDPGIVKRFVVHVDVLGDEVGLDRLDDCDRGEEEYGDDVLECDEAGAVRPAQMSAGTTGDQTHKSNERVEDGRGRRIYAQFIYLDARIRLTVRDTIDHCRERTDDEQKDNVDDDVKVGFLGDLGLFRWCYTPVQVYLGVRGVKATKPIILSKQWKGGVENFAGFQVGLPVQVFGLQVADPVRIRSR